MRRSNSKSTGCMAVIGCAILLLFLSTPAYSQQDGTALMLELSPVGGGRVNLEAGVHFFDRDDEVTLKAVPSPGYQFVYWIGNVTEATSSTTVVCLDTPKIVIAVFERSKFEFVEVEEKPQILAGRGRLRRSPRDYAQGLEQAIGGQRPSKFRFTPPEPREESPVPEQVPEVPVPEVVADVPVPEEGNDFPVPVPEPATIMFLSAEIFILRKTRRAELRQRTL